MRLYIYSLLIFVYILSQFLSIPGFSLFTGILANIVIFISLFFAKGLFFYSGIAFYAIGTILFFQTGASWQDYFLSFQTMLGILSFFFMLPFLNSLIRVGKYDHGLRKFMEQGADTVTQLYRRSFFVCHVLGLFLNIATFAVLMRTLDRTFTSIPQKVKAKFYTQNLLRAYALCLAWSPLEIMVITALNITGQSYIYIFPFIITIVIIVILFDILTASFKYPKLRLQSEDDQADHSGTTGRKIKQLIVLLLLLVTCVSIVNQWSSFDYLFTLVLFIAPVSFLWAAFIKRLRRYAFFAFNQWKTRTKGMANFFFMFLSAGLFVQMLAGTSLFELLQQLFTSMHQQVFIFYLLVGAYFLISSFIGFHPLVSVILLAEIIAPSLADLQAIPLALVLIVCSLSPVMFSLFNISVSIVGYHLHTNPYRLGLWNLPFVIGYMLFTMSFAYILQLLM
ncbi:hypothetical protein CHL76_08020 [Marinococcus halophilus]|uniref:Uncharacterized protein n=1 Tax=Marinococcus halophilus TaxID=1371 RepID=A0A510Y5C3_MARHA|nr:hypothetical protein [Marinococcus halophilus]OZT80462.1 hypothetical protein CHL76_08020 [Marinococcus halophilus]GEK58534.1 hypothetical protein MHA01_14390 [Marinococcus halophilus]